MATAETSLNKVLLSPAHDRLAVLLDDLEQELGAVEPRVMEEVRRSWPAPAKEPQDV